MSASAPAAKPVERVADAFQLVRKRCLPLLAVLLGFLSQAVAAGHQPDALRFGVLSIAPPARIHARWQDFTRYLSDRLGQPVSIVVPRGFGKMKQAIDAEEIDVFYVNSYVFYRLRQEGRAVGLAQMENIDGKTTSRSEIYVRSDSGIDDVRQLEGRRIAYISPMGAGGYLAPRAYLYTRGVETAQEVFTRNLSSSIHEVLIGDIDGGTMCGVNYRLMSEKLDTGELRVIGVSDAYPENLIAARSDLPADMIRRIRSIIVGMDNTPAGRKVLAGMHPMKIGRFLPYDPAVEAVTRTLLKQARVEP